MSKGFLLAFVAVAGVAAGAVDYVNQTRRAGLPLGQMSPGSYVATISGRFLDSRAQVAAAAEHAALLAQPMTSHLPPAPEGWVRRDWHDGDQARLYAQPADAEPVQIAYTDADGRPVTATIDAAARARIPGTEFAVYERPGALVAIRLHREAPLGGLMGFSQDAMKMIDANIKGMSDSTGFAVIQGVTFIQTRGVFGDDITGNPFRIFDARVGPEVAMEVRAAGPDDEIKELLAAIDFDRLNQLNATPAGGIGSAAPAAIVDSPEAIAAAAEAQRQRDQLEGTLAEIRVMEASANLMLNAGKLSPEAHAEQLADLAARRDAVIARAAAAEALAAGAASAAAGTPQTDAVADAVADTGAEGGYGAFLGLTGKLAGLFGGTAEPAVVAEAGPAAPEITVNRSSGGSLGGSCTTEGAFKRCTVGD